MCLEVLEDWLEKEHRYFWMQAKQTQSNTSRPCLHSLCKERSSKASESGEKDLKDCDRLLRNVNRSIGSLAQGF